MKSLFLIIGAAVFLMSAQTAGAGSKRVLVDGRGDTYRLAVPAKVVCGPVSVGPLYHSVPKNPQLYFKPDAAFLVGKTNVPTMIPILRK